MNKTCRFFLLIGAVMIFIAGTSTAQNIKLQRWTFGNGGTVASVKGDKMLTGVAGQIAIESRLSTNLNVHQGFWVPYPDTAGTGVEEDQISFSNGIANYPNPFTNNTTIRYTLQGTSYVTLKIFDMVGQEILSLNGGMQEPGDKNIEWNGADKFGVNVGAGSYIYELQVQPAQISGYTGSRPYSLRNVMVVIR
jgi:hypothetical protein